MTAALAVAAVLAALAVIKDARAAPPAHRRPGRDRGVRRRAAARGGLRDVGALAAAGWRRSISRCSGRSRSSPASARRSGTTACSPIAASAPRRGSRRRRSRRGRWRCRAGRSTGPPATSSTTRTPTATAIRTARSTASCTPTSAGSSPSARPSGSATAAGSWTTPSSWRSSAPRWCGSRSACVVPALIDGWRGLLWGGIVRIAIHNHTMFAVNSICHAFGSQPFQTGDESRNNRLIAALAFGEGWHNNHHAFPAAAYHGMGRHPDVTGMVIRALERTGLAWDVHRPSPAAVARRLVQDPPIGVIAAALAVCENTARSTGARTTDPDPHSSTLRPTDRPIPATLGGPDRALPAVLLHRPGGRDIGVGRRADRSRSSAARCAEWSSGYDAWSARIHPEDRDRVLATNAAVPAHRRAPRATSTGSCCRTGASAGSTSGRS